MTSPAQNIMLTISYDGTGYHGWQVQPNGITVQECLESAIATLTGESLRVLCAGRTDSGVHALGQVASFQTRSRIPPQQFRRGLQRYLPDDITIVRSARVADDFHATYSAIRKRYRYLMWDGPVIPPYLRGYAYQPRRAIQVERMREALPGLLGTHDFRCFETNYPNKATSVRTISDATIRRSPAPEFWAPAESWQPTDVRPHEDRQRPLISFEVEADGFLYNMVRAIVGTLLRIGNLQRPVGYLHEVMKSMDRSMAGSTAPAHGLYLVQVDYPPELQRVPE
ncbi:MAG: tRNA pseudouridine(38-40) synthase TruA [Planctomycetaceae bacterium]|jgi:tRNA pseudouridine38-40 synthase